MIYLESVRVNLFFNHPDQPKQHDGANHGHHQPAQQTVGDDPDQSKQKATQQRPQDPYYEISKQAKAAAFGELAREPARQDPYEYNPNQVQHRGSPATWKCRPRLGAPIAPCDGLYACAVSARSERPLL